MLVDVSDDEQFQRYLDVTEQALYVEMAAAMQATIRLQVTRNSIQSTTYLTKRGGDLLNHYYRKIYRDQYNAVSDDLETKAAGVSLFLAEQLLYLTRRAAKKIVGINESLREEISKLMLEMVGQGKSSQQITKEIVKLSPDISRRRAALIARTETHASAVSAIDASLAHKKIKVQTKTWWSAGDNRVRDTHKAAHGETVPYAQPFEVGGQSS